MDRGMRELLGRRFVDVRAQAARTVVAARATTDRAREVTVATRDARRDRWVLRYERAFRRKSAEIGELTIDRD